MAKKFQKLHEILQIDYPILVAPMFLVSNTQMVIAALESGVTAAIPALNYRTDGELRKAILEIKDKTDRPFGINLIVNKSNTRYRSQLATVCAMRVSFVITSLGNPKKVIEKCKPLGIKVFCDVVNLEHAQKAEQLGADALIAVGREAGGHCGPVSLKKLVPQLVANCSIPVIAAGGVGKKEHIEQLLTLGAAGVSVGTIFIASKESPVSDEYKQAIIQYSGADIVLTTKLSGSHLTVINTPYVQQIGTKAGLLEKLMKRHKWLKKWLRMLIFARGMRKIEQSAFKASYQSVWVAGPAIEHVKAVCPLKAIVSELTEGLQF